MSQKRKIVVMHPCGSQIIEISRDSVDQSVSTVIQCGYDKIIAIVDQHFQGTVFIEDIQSASETIQVLYVDTQHQEKDWNMVGSLVASLQALGATRNSCLLAIGGGFIGDVAGFLASIFMRGIDFYFMPTTLMSQADSVMGKLAINYGSQKNTLGVFGFTKRTFCDVELLKSNSRKMLLEGMVEIWKSGIIDGDIDLIGCVRQYLFDPRDSDLEHMITRSLEIKKKYVENDVCDKRGLHKALSLGHTFSNYFETRIAGTSHGVGVCYGIVMATAVAQHLSEIDDQRFAEIISIGKLFLSELQIPGFSSQIDIDQMIEYFARDKMSDYGNINLILPTNDSFRFYRGVSRESLFKAKELLESLGY